MNRLDKEHRRFRQQTISALDTTDVRTENFHPSRLSDVAKLNEDLNKKIIINKKHPKAITLNSQ